MSACVDGTRLVIASQHEHTLVVRNEQQREKREESREREVRRGKNAARDERRETGGERREM